LITIFRAGVRPAEGGQRELRNPTQPVRPAWFKTAITACDPAHGWQAIRTSTTTAKRWFPIRTGGRRFAMGYSITNLPFYYELANTFAIGDKLFLDARSWPNRMYFTPARATGSPKIRPTDVNVRICSACSAAPDQVARLPLELRAGDVLPRLDGSLSPAARRCPAPCRTSSILRRCASGNFAPNTFLDRSTSRHLRDQRAPARQHADRQRCVARGRCAHQSPAWKRAPDHHLRQHGGFADHVTPPPVAIRHR
jgi:hypothetical protein